MMVPMVTSFVKMSGGSDITELIFSFLQRPGCYYLYHGSVPVSLLVYVGRTRVGD